MFEEQSFPRLTSCSINFKARPSTRTPTPTQTTKQQMDCYTIIKSFLKDQKATYLWSHALKQNLNIIYCAELATANSFIMDGII